MTVKQHVNANPEAPAEDKRSAMRDIYSRVPSIRSRANELVGGSTVSVAGERATSGPAGGTVPALVHSIAIMSYLNGQSPEPATLAEISTRLAITKSHCHSILRTLVHFDWVAFDARFKTYTLQSGVLSDISSLLNSPTLEQIRTSLTALVERVTVPCVLSQPLPDRSFVVIDTFRSRHFMQIFYPIGHRFPENACAQMRAHLAWQPAEAIDAWMETWHGVPYTRHTILDRQAVRAEIDATRSRGYARSQCEFSEGMIGLGLPVFDRNAKVAYVISCSYLAADKTFDETEIAAEMHKSVAEIHRATMARPAPDFL